MLLYEMVTCVLEPEMYMPPPCQIREVLASGQFTEVSSAGASEESAWKVPNPTIYIL